MEDFVNKGRLLFAKEFCSCLDRLILNKKALSGKSYYYNPDGSVSIFKTPQKHNPALGKRLPKNKK